MSVTTCEKEFQLIVKSGPTFSWMMVSNADGVIKGIPSPATPLAFGCFENWVAGPDPTRNPIESTSSKVIGANSFLVTIKSHVMNCTDGSVCCAPGACKHPSIEFAQIVFTVTGGDTGKLASFSMPWVWPGGDPSLNCAISDCWGRLTGDINVYDQLGHFIDSDIIVDWDASAGDPAGSGTETWSKFVPIGQTYTFTFRIIGGNTVGPESVGATLTLT